MRRQSCTRLFFFERGKARVRRTRQVDLAPQGQHAFDVLGRQQPAEADFVRPDLLAPPEEGRRRMVDHALVRRSVLAAQAHQRGSRRCRCTVAVRAASQLLARP